MYWRYSSFPICSECKESPCCHWQDDLWKCHYSYLLTVQGELLLSLIWWSVEVLLFLSAHSARRVPVVTVARWSVEMSLFLSIHSARRAPVFTDMMVCGNTIPICSQCIESSCCHCDMMVCGSVNNPICSQCSESSCYWCNMMICGSVTISIFLQCKENSCCHWHDGLWKHYSHLLTVHGELLLSLTSWSVVVSIILSAHSAMRAPVVTVTWWSVEVALFWSTHNARRAPLCCRCDMMVCGNVTIPIYMEWKESTSCHCDMIFCGSVIISIEQICDMMVCSSITISIYSQCKERDRMVSGSVTFYLLTMQGERYDGLWKFHYSYLLTVKGEHDCDMIICGSVTISVSHLSNARMCNHRLRTRNN